MAIFRLPLRELGATHTHQLGVLGHFLLLLAVLAVVASRIYHPLFRMIRWAFKWASCRLPEGPFPPETQRRFPNLFPLLLLGLTICHLVMQEGLMMEALRLSRYQSMVLLWLH